MREAAADSANGCADKSSSAGMAASGGPNDPKLIGGGPGCQPAGEGEDQEQKDKKKEEQEKADKEKKEEEARRAKERQEAEDKAREARVASGHSEAKDESKGKETEQEGEQAGNGQQEDKEKRQRQEQEDEEAKDEHGQEKAEAAAPAEAEGGTSNLHRSANKDSKIDDGASTVSSFVRSNGGPEKALKVYIASFGIGHTGTSPLGSRAPCRLFRSLRLISSLESEFEHKIRAITQKAEIAAISVQLKPFKSAYVDLINMSRAAASRCEAAVESAKLTKDYHYLSCQSGSWGGRDVEVGTGVG